MIGYDDSGGGTAGRLVWMLRVLGHPAALLDGGLRAWPEPPESGAGTTRPAVAVPARPWPIERFADHAQVATAAGAGSGAVVLDARSAPRYRRRGRQRSTPGPGTSRVPANVPGRRTSTRETGRFRTASELRGALRVASASGRTPRWSATAAPGVSACADLLALERVGVDRTRLYVPSWSGWSADPARPAATGGVDPGPSSSVAPGVRSDPRSPHADTIVVSPEVLRDLRRDRRRRRVAGIEWFEALYRAYLTGGIGIIAVLFLSSAVGDDQLVAEQRRRRAPARPPPPSVSSPPSVAAVGLRAGSRGGPLALEKAEVAHVLLAPVDRRRALLVPALKPGPLRRLRRRGGRGDRRPAGVSPPARHPAAVGGQRRLAGRSSASSTRRRLPGLRVGGCPDGWPPCSPGPGSSPGPSPTWWGRCRLPSAPIGALAIWPLEHHWWALVAIPVVAASSSSGCSASAGCRSKPAERRTRPRRPAALRGDRARPAHGDGPPPPARPGAAPHAALGPPARAAPATPSGAGTSTASCASPLVRLAPHGRAHGRSPRSPCTSPTTTPRRPRSSPASRCTWSASTPSSPWPRRSTRPIGPDAIPKERGVLLAPPPAGARAAPGPVRGHRRRRRLRPQPHEHRARR